MALPNYIRQETNLTGEIVNANVAAAGLEIQVAFVDKKTGEARTPQDTTLQFVINKDNSKFEIIRAESHVTADGVTTITVKADGRKIPSFGSGSGGAIGNSHNIGDSVSCVYTADQVNNIIEVLEGNFATGASELKLGTEANGDITITFENGEANKPFLKWDQAAGALLFSNNGVDTLAIGTGGGDIQSGGGTTVDGGVLNINLGDETIFTTDGGAGNEGLAVVTDENGLIDPSLIPYEFVTSSAGADDSGKGVLLDANGQLDSSFINASAIDTSTYITAEIYGNETEFAIPLTQAEINAVNTTGIPVYRKTLNRTVKGTAGINTFASEGASDTTLATALQFDIKYYFKINMTNARLTGQAATGFSPFPQGGGAGDVRYRWKVVGSDENGLPDPNNVKHQRSVTYVDTSDHIGIANIDISDGDWVEWEQIPEGTANPIVWRAVPSQAGNAFVGNDPNNLTELNDGFLIPHFYIQPAGSYTSVEKVSGVNGIQQFVTAHTTNSTEYSLDYLGWLTQINPDGTGIVNISKEVPLSGYTGNVYALDDGVIGYKSDVAGFSWQRLHLGYASGGVLSINPNDVCAYKVSTSYANPGFNSTSVTNTVEFPILTESKTFIANSTGFSGEGVVGVAIEYPVNANLTAFNNVQPGNFIKYY